MKARYGSGHCEVLFTATPKAETLLSHGTRLPDGSLQAFHCFTQRNAVSARQVLNPLEFYTNATSQLTVNGIRLAAMKDIPPLLGGNRLHHELVLAKARAIYEC